MTPLHILLLASYAPSLVNFRGPLIRDIQIAGHKVSVGAPDISPNMRAQLEALGTNVYETPLRRTGTSIFADINYGAALWRLISQIRPDIVLTYTIKPNIWGAFAAAHLGIPSIAMITGLGYAFTDKGAATPRQRLVRGIARWLYRAATNRNARVIFQNPDDRDDFIGAGCLADPSKTRMVDGSGVDMVHYKHEPLPDAPVFLMIARLLQNKGVREYAEASLRILHEHPDARCFLVGPFDEGPDGVSKADLDFWIAGGLEYIGPADDVRPYLAACRTYVLPSYREGTPRSVLEAMATGRPIITSDAPGCRETVEDGVNGFLVPVRNHEALASRMRDMIDDPNRTAEMGEQSFRIAKEKYDVRKVNTQLMGHLGLLDDSPLEYPGV